MSNNVTVNFIKLYSLPVFAEGKLSALELVVFSILFEKAKTTPDSTVSLSYSRLLKIIPFRTNIPAIRKSVVSLKNKQFISVLRVGRGRGISCSYVVNISRLSEKIKKYQEYQNVGKVL